MTLIVKGLRAAFDVDPDREILVRPSSGMMHDPEGTSWPRCTLLFGPFERGPVADPDSESYDEAKEYFGERTRVREGVIDRPPRPLGAWERLGTVEQIWYTRPGSRFRGRFRHPFNSPGIVRRLFKGRGRRPVLYARGAFLRLELHHGCVLDELGIRYP